MIAQLIKLPILKRLIPSFYKRYLFLFKRYKKDIIIDDIKYHLDLRHLIDRRFFFTKHTKMNFFNQFVI